jgi:hypothetical protein
MHHAKAPACTAARLHGLLLLCAVQIDTWMHSSRLAICWVIAIQLDFPSYFCRECGLRACDFQTAVLQLLSCCTAGRASGGLAMAPCQRAG